MNALSLSFRGDPSRLAPAHESGSTWTVDSGPICQRFDRRLEKRPSRRWGPQPNKFTYAAAA